MSFHTGFLPRAPSFSKSIQPFSESTLFIGDLSYLCNEKTLYELFQVYGSIESIQLKKSEHDHQKNHIGYGFISFSTVSAAAQALQEMNGQLVLGRSIRVGWANANSNNLKGSFHSIRSPSPTSIQLSTSPTSSGFGVQQQLRRSKASVPTVQVHVSFTAAITREAVTELTLRNIFQEFGEVVDATIKKVYLKDLLGVQSGYGFIHYRLSHEGIQAALRAIQSVHRTTMDCVFYECKETHELRAQLASLQQHSVPNVHRGSSNLANNYRPSPLIHGSTFPHHTNARISPNQGLFSQKPVFNNDIFSSTSPIFSSSPTDPSFDGLEEVKSDNLHNDHFLQGITNYCLFNQSNDEPKEIRGSFSIPLGNNPFTSSMYDCSSLIDSLISPNSTH